MIAVPSLLSERLRNRATVLRMMATGELKLIRAELADIARHLDADAERAMRMEIRRAEAQ